MRLWKPIAVLLFCGVARGQAPNAPLDAGYRHLYNLEFADAHRSFQEWERQQPDDPMGPVSDAAAYLFSEFARLHILESEFFTHDQHFIADHKLAPDPAVKRNFYAALASAEKLASRSPSDENSMFASVLAGGLRSDYTALIDKRYVQSFKEMKASRQMAQRLLAVYPRCYDAWLAVGVENYLLSLKPLVVRFFARLAGGQTDREEGVERLRLTAEKGRYLAPLARLMLAVAALRDGDKNRARDLLKGLIREYPRNPLYPLELARLDAAAPNTN
ncbi:MAG: hypothetical protein ABSC23_00785 [Bryobacteraceae bacterium]|jgi:hypothetical protein